MTVLPIKPSKNFLFIGFLLLAVLGYLFILQSKSMKKINSKLLIYSLAVDRPGNAKKFNSTRVRSNRDNYVALHEGISYFQQTVEDTDTRFLAWQKVKDYPKVKEGHEWIWILDSDAFIMNGETSALALIRSQLAAEAKISTRQIDIVLCRQTGGVINTGSLFIRSSAWTDRFVERYCTSL
jgi:hypothetical protein